VEAITIIAKSTGHGGEAAWKAKPTSWFFFREENA
jgi:hypothetical protein